MPRRNNVGSISHNGFVSTDPDGYQVYQAGQQVYSTYSMEEEEHNVKYRYVANGIHNESQPQEEFNDNDSHRFMKNLKPGPNGFVELPFEVAQNYFDVTELEDQACSSTGRTKFRVMINGQEMIIDGTVTPVSEYNAQHQQPPVEIEMEGMQEAPPGYSVMQIPESMISNGQSMQVITLPDGQLALQVTQTEQKPQMAQMVTIDESGNIISTDGASFAIGMADQPQQPAHTMLTMQQDEYGNMYLQEEAGPSTSSGMGEYGYTEVIGDPAEIAAMYPGMQMMTVNPDGTLESVNPSSSLPPPTADTTYVNSKQFHRIMKRREARARLEASGRVPKNRSKYLHESRHRHACNRVRGEGGKFNSKKGKEGMNTSGSTDEHSPAKIVKLEIENSPDKKLNESTEEKEITPIAPKRDFRKLPVKRLGNYPAPALKARNSTPLTIKSPPAPTQPRPTAVITHLPLPPQSKSRPAGFRAARPSEINKLLPTTYAEPKTTATKVETLPEKILEESPSNSNSPPPASEAKRHDHSEFTHINL